MTDITFYDKQRNRWYRDPSNPTRTYAGVTSILNVKDAPWLARARVKGTAEYAATHRKALAEMTKAEVVALLNSQNVTLPDWKVATDFGTATHTVIENIINDRPLGQGVRHVEGTKSYPVSNTFTEFVPQYFSEFRAKHNVQVLDCEKVVVSDIWGHAGRFDAVMIVDDEIMIVDTKTNKPGPRAKTALQNKAYCTYTEIIDPVTGARSPMHKVTASRVLWMREEGWNLFELAFDDSVADDFRHHLDLFAFGKLREDSLIKGAIHKDQLQTPNSFY